MKHFDKRIAKSDARRERRRAHLEVQLGPLVGQAGMVLLRLDVLGS